MIDSGSAEAEARDRLSTRGFAQTERDIAALQQSNRMLRDSVNDLAAEIETLKDEREQILGTIQTRLQPDGSPPPGGPVALINWITNVAWKRVADLERQLEHLAACASEILTYPFGVMTDDTYASFMRARTGLVAAVDAARRKEDPDAK